MDLCEQRYRRVVGSVGLAMLSFLILINLFGVVIQLVPPLLALLGVGEIAAEILYELLYGVGYLLTFMLPVLVLKLVFGVRKLPYRSMLAEPRLSPWLPLILFAGISLIFVQAYVNAALMDLIGYSLDGLVEETPVDRPYRMVLQLITMCLVPGFCEEFLFRGAILTNCLPFGRTPAILISSLLFALMHQNAGQFLYTFAAGILLGVVYEATGSIWNCVILHTVNNFVSVIQSAFLANLTDQMGSVACLLLEVGIFFLGAISLAILVVRFYGHRPRVENGFFGRELRASDGFATCPVTPQRMLRLALTPSTVIFGVFCILEMVALIALVKITHGIL